MNQDDMNMNTPPIFHISSFIDSVLCLLTSTLRGLIDDRYIRCQSVSSTLIDPLMICLRLITTTAPSYYCHDKENTLISNQTNIPTYSPIKIQKSMNMNSSIHTSSTSTTNPSFISNSTTSTTSTNQFISSQDPTKMTSSSSTTAAVVVGENDATTITSQFPMRFDIDLARLCDTRHDIESTSQGAEFLIGKFDSTPDVKQSSPRRCCLSLFLQLIARCIIHEDVVSNDTPRMSMKKHLISSSTSTIQRFRKLGGEAMLIHLLLSHNKSTHVQLTMSDKHFILWILRECVVSGLKNNDEAAATEILRWMLWPLNSPLSEELNLYDNNSNNNNTTTKDIVPTTYGPRFLSSVSLAYNKKKMSSDLKSGGNNRPMTTMEKSTTHIAIDCDDTDTSNIRPPTPSFNINMNTNITSATATTVPTLHKYSIFPIARPTISLSLRVLLLQELRLLLSGDDESQMNHISVYNTPLTTVSHNTSHQNSQDFEEPIDNNIKGYVYNSNDEIDTLNYNDINNIYYDQYHKFKSSQNAIMYLPVKGVMVSKSSNSFYFRQKGFSNEVSPRLSTTTSTERRREHSFLNLSQSSTFSNPNGTGIGGSSGNLNYQNPTSIFTQRASMISRVPVSLSTVRSLFLAAGGLDSLVKICFGELSDYRLKYLFLFMESSSCSNNNGGTSSTPTPPAGVASGHHHNHHSSTSTSTTSKFSNYNNLVDEEVSWQDLDTFSEMHIEHWFSSLVLLWSIVSNCNEAKDALEELVSIKSLTNLLFLITRESDINVTLNERMQVDRHTYLTNSLLLSMIIELCVKNGRCTAHTKSFIATSLKLPSLHTSNCDKSKNSVSSPIQPLKPGTPGASINDRGKLNLTKAMLILRCKLFQKAVTNVTVYHDSSGLNANTTLEKHQSLAMLSPTYFATERTICHTYSCMVPLQLTLKNDMFARKVPLATHQFGSNHGTDPLSHSVSNNTSNSRFGFWSTNSTSSTSSTATNPSAPVSTTLSPILSTTFQPSIVVDSEFGLSITKHTLMNPSLHSSNGTNSYGNGNGVVTLSSVHSLNSSNHSHRNVRASKQVVHSSSSSLQNLIPDTPGSASGTSGTGGTVTGHEAWEVESISASVNSLQSQNSLIAFTQAMKLYSTNNNDNNNLNHNILPLPGTSTPMTSASSQHIALRQSRAMNLSNYPKSGLSNSDLHLNLPIGGPYTNQLTRMLQLKPLPYRIDYLKDKGWTMQNIQTKLTLILHGALLFKSGIKFADIMSNSMDNDDDEADEETSTVGGGDSIIFENILHDTNHIITQSNPNLTNRKSLTYQNAISATILQTKLKMLQKNLQLFYFNDKNDGDNNSQSMTTTSINNSNSLLLSESKYQIKSYWHPSFSSLKFRSPSTADILFAVAIIARGDTQLEVLSFLSNLIDENPYNAKVLTRSRNHMIENIVKLLPVVKDKLRSSLSTILSQLLRYHVNTAAVKSLSRLTSQSLGNKIISSSSSSNYSMNMNMNIDMEDFNHTQDDTTNQVLYILGRAAERENPGKNKNIFILIILYFVDFFNLKYYFLVNSSIRTFCTNFTISFEFITTSYCEVSYC